MAHLNHPEEVQFLAELQRFQNGLLLREMTCSAMQFWDELTHKMEESGNATFQRQRDPHAERSWPLVVSQSTHTMYIICLTQPGGQQGPFQQNLKSRQRDCAYAVEL